VGRRQLNTARQLHLPITNLQVYALDPEFHEYAMGYMDKGVLSNGFYGVLLASALCHKVTVYGFLHQWKGSAKYHYYDDVQPDGQQVRIRVEPFGTYPSHLRFACELRKSFQQRVRWGSPY